MPTSCGRAAGSGIPTTASPAKTAGTPVLEVIVHSGLTDLIVVVTRYFGGILLGTGGLVRAYTTAASRALDAAEKVTVQPVVKLSTMVEYPLYERVDLLVAAAGGRMEAPVFTDKVALTWQMRRAPRRPLLEQLRELTRGPGPCGGVGTLLRGGLSGWKIFPASSIRPLVTHPLC